MSNDKEFVGFSAKIDGEQFITNNGKQVWSGIGPLKNALHYHATRWMKESKQVEFYKVYNTQEPYIISKIILPEDDKYVYKSVSFEDVKNE